MYIFFVLKEFIFKLLNKSLRNHKKVCVLINLDQAIITSIFFSQNVMQNVIVHELEFTVNSASEFLELQLEKIYPCAYLHETHRCIKVFAL